MCWGAPFSLCAVMEVRQLQSRCLVPHSVHPKFLVVISTLCLDTACR